MIIEVGIFVRDATPERRWLVAIGQRRSVELLFEWCVRSIGPPGPNWFSMVGEDEDAYFLELHIFSEPSYAAFQARFQSEFLPNEFPFEPDIETHYYDLLPIEFCG